MTSAKHLVFIDENLSDIALIVESLPEGSQWFTVSGSIDGISHIEQISKGYENLDSITYCTHDVLNSACCFCGGGSIILEEEDIILLQDSNKWMYIGKNGEAKDCDWVGKRPNKRCNKKGKEMTKKIRLPIGRSKKIGR